MSEASVTSPSDEGADLMPLLSAGQLEPGDIVWLTFKDQRRTYDVEIVMNPGTDIEEIILDIDENLCFITSMAIDGSSWAKNVMMVGR
jgi:hypothetical protein